RRFLSGPRRAHASPRPPVARARLPERSKRTPRRKRARRPGRTRRAPIGPPRGAFHRRALRARDRPPARRRRGQKAERAASSDETEPFESLHYLPKALLGRFAIGVQMD